MALIDKAALAEKARQAVIRFWQPELRRRLAERFSRTRLWPKTPAGADSAINPGKEEIMDKVLQSVLAASLPTIIPLLVPIVKSMIAGLIQKAYTEAKNTESNLDDAAWQAVAQLFNVNLEAA